MQSLQISNRIEQLKKIIRYHSYVPMYYRSNLYMHSHRIGWMIQETASAIKHIYPQFDEQVAIIMGHIHDDHEIMMGDVQFGEKLSFTEEQKKDLQNKELVAIEEVAKMFPETIEGYNYKELLLRYQKIDSNDLEAIVVKYFDKFDAFGEALHEIFAGNMTFTQPFGKSQIAPVESYYPVLQPFHVKFFIFQKIRENDVHPIFNIPTHIDTTETAKNGKLHTFESLQEKTSYEPYNIWRETLLKQGGEEAREWLIKKIE